MWLAAGAALMPAGPVAELVVGRGFTHLTRSGALELFAFCLAKQQPGWRDRSPDPWQPAAEVLRPRKDWLNAYSTTKDQHFTNTVGQAFSRHP